MLLKIYPAGHNVVIYDAVHKTQKIIAASDKGEDVITAICVSPNKRYPFTKERGEGGGRGGLLLKKKKKGN